jgi:hypothetical protein
MISLSINECFASHHIALSKGISVRGSERRKRDNVSATRR